MNLLDMLRQLGSQGINLLGAIHGMSKTDLAACGLSGSIASRWLKAADSFYGPTKRTRAQKACVEAARAAGHSIEALIAIDRHTRALLEGDQWDLRLELCQLTGTVDDINRKATAIVRERNRAIDNAERYAYGRRSIKGGKNTDARGCRTMTITGPERDIARLRNTWEKKARSLRRTNPQLSYEQAMYDAMMTTKSAATETLTPLVVVKLPDWAKVLRHEGDETIFGLTDGTTIPGAQLMKQLADDHHLAMIYDPVEGPVNLYRTQRTANEKQRLMLNAESLLCEWSGCTTPAEEAQTHHITAWKHGGKTNVGEMSKLCKLHNSLNDDDPNAPPRHGRLTRDGARIGHTTLPPDGNPLRQLSARGLMTAE